MRKPRVKKSVYVMNYAYFAEWRWKEEKTHEDEFRFSVERKADCSVPIDTFAEKKAIALIRKMHRSGKLLRLYRVENCGVNDSQEKLGELFDREYKYCLTRVRDYDVQVWLVDYQLPRNFLAGIYLSKAEAEKHPNSKSEKHATIIYGCPIDQIESQCDLLPWHRKRIAQLREEVKRFNSAK
ncbi:MAG: hypothetical protein V1928_02035 [Parcubacteria group bacterium]